MKVLITGAAGLLGSHAVKRLSISHDVHAIVRCIGDAERGNAAVCWHQLDLSSSWTASGLPGRIDTVIHLAQSSKFRDFPSQALDVFGVNVSSTARLLDYALKAGATRFILASSGGVYGAGDEAFRENSPIPFHGELGYYLGSKLCSEVLAQNYSSHMDITILRFFFIYGFGQRRSMLIPRIVDSVREGRPVTLQGEHGIRINPINVADAVTALSSCFGLSGSSTFNIAGPDILSIRELADAVGRVVGRPPIFVQADGRPRHLIADIEAMKSQLHCPSIHFSSGVKDAL